MIEFKNLNIQNKILLGIGLSFLVAMIFLLVIVIYQFEGLVFDGKELLRDELLEQKWEQHEKLARSRASILAEIYQIKDEVTTSQFEKLLTDISRSSADGNKHLFIYNLSGKAIYQPPLEVEDLNRWKVEIEGRDLRAERSQLAQTGGGRITYPYINPQSGAIETRYSYIAPIDGTDYFVETGGYKSDYYNILAEVKNEILTMRENIIHILVVGFIIVIIVMIILIALISNYFKRHINLLLDGFKQVSKGKINFSLDVDSKDEFGELILGFNAMLKQINHLTYSDPLTGLPNMKLLYNNLNSDLKDFTSQDKNIYLCTLGLENFNLINSNYGYEAGNNLLQKIANRLSELLPKKMIIVRKNYEFVFYYKTRANRAQITELAEGLQKKLSQPYTLDENIIYIKPKLGIAVAKDEQEFDLIKRSSLALYFAYKNEANILYYQRDMESKLSDRMNLETKLRIAIRNEEFLLNYQPLVNAQSNQIIGFEALIRWKHPQDGIISPGEFIPVAESTELIIPIGNWVLKRSCQQLKKWHQAGYDKLFVSVNIAPQQFQQLDFLSNIEAVIEETGINPNYLKLEITERAAIENVEYTIHILSELKSLGVKIAIDDFGTGYSSLEYLNRFKLDTLKIDKAFIQDRANSDIVKTIIMMGANLNLEVIAEGVETEQELEFLLKNQCFIYQGYLFSRPLVAQAATELLTENNKQ